MSNRSMHANHMPMQSRVREDRAFVYYRCSLCQIDYRIQHSQHPVCPLCEANREMEALRQEIARMAQESDLREQDLHQAEALGDLASLLREALSLAEFEDLAQIKAMVYRYRADPDNVSVTAGLHGGNRAIYLRDRGGHDEWRPTSIGGKAFADTYADLIKARGQARAMEICAEVVAGRLTA